MGVGVVQMRDGDKPLGYGYIAANFCGGVRHSCGECSARVLTRMQANAPDHTGTADYVLVYLPIVVKPLV